MKRTLAICLLLAASAVHADYYYGDRIDTYDPVSGLYYKAVSDKERSGFLSSGKSGAGPANLAITNPATGATVLLFKGPLQGSVSGVLFETGFKDGSMEFFGGAESNVLNNKGVARRDPKNKLLVIVRNKEEDQYQTELYVADKNGDNLRKVATVSKGADWHIDVRNSKVRVVFQLGNGIKIESYDW